jgi:hypothetical protein
MSLDSSTNPPGALIKGSPSLAKLVLGRFLFLPAVEKGFGLTRFSAVELPPQVLTKLVPHSMVCLELLVVSKPLVDELQHVLPTYKMYATSP